MCDEFFSFFFLVFLCNDNKPFSVTHNPAQTSIPSAPEPDASHSDMDDVINTVSRKRHFCSLTIKVGCHFSLLLHEIQVEISIARSLRFGAHLRHLQRGVECRPQPALAFDRRILNITVPGILHRPSVIGRYKKNRSEANYIPSLDLKAANHSFDCRACQTASRTHIH